jgi:hypothetical protein
MEGHTHRDKEADRFANQKWHHAKPDHPYPYMQDPTLSIDNKLRKFAKEHPDNTALKFVYELYKLKII